MDIRNWFAATSKGSRGSKASEVQKLPKQSNNKSPVKEVKKKKRRIVDSDSDEEVKKTKREKASTNGKRRSTDEDTGSGKKQRISKNIVVVSSDEECVIEDSDSPVKRCSPRKQQNSNDSKKTAAKEPVASKAVSVSDFFGAAPVKRVSKKTSGKDPLPVVKTEKNHEDQDFLKTLSQLDEFKHKSTQEQQKKEDMKSEKKSSPTDVKMEKKSSPTDIKIEKKSLPTDMKSPIDVKIGNKSPAGVKTEKKYSPKKAQRGKSSKKSLTKMEMTPPVEKKKPPVITPPPEKKTPAKKGNSALYFSYLNRQGPTALGSKEIPEGEQNCLKGKTFLITGVLESIERDDAKELIEKYGGKLMATLSKNTNYIVIGRDAGTSKLDKAVKLGTTQLDEDGLFDLIRTSPGTGPKKVPAPVDTPAVVAENKLTAKTEESNKSDHSPFKTPKTEKSENQEKSLKKTTKTEKSDLENAAKKIKAEKSEVLQTTVKEKDSIMDPPPKVNIGSDMWVDRYKPTSLKKLIGQQGANSNANKLLNWLKNWRKHTKQKKAPAGRWGGNNDGSGFKAALLSGPPGVGKTTTAQLVCKELGFDYLELNASDTRSKKCLNNVVSELLLNKSLSACFRGDNKGTVSSNHAIIMDEVDGMAGNEDRGGIQELISFIKKSKIPIICICNDRNHPKIRSLSNHCFDLRFQKPRVEQIKAAMLSIAYKEGLQVTPNVINEVIVASNQDIRQVLHNLSVWCAKSKGLTEEQAKKDIGFGIKHSKMSPFDVLREVFAIGNNKKATINDKANLFFHDYSIAPLFVQENYVHVLPSAAGNDQKKHLHLLSEAANSICVGDIIDKQIRSRSSWNLLPMQAIFASVIPGELLTGHLRQMISFPAWLGKNSNRNRNSRTLQELQMHMRMKVTGDKIDVAMDYLPILKHSLTEPLIEDESEGIIDVLRVMNAYYLLREDFDSVIELSLWSNQKDPRTQISSKVKSAFTRAYNKHCQQNPYAAPSASKKKKKGAPSYSEELLNEEDNYESEDGDSDDESIENNRMIRVTRQTASKAGDSASSSKATAKKGRTKK